MRTVGLLLLGLGLGLGLGAVLVGGDVLTGGVLVGSTLGLVALGAALLGWSSGHTPDLVPPQSPAAPGKPALAGLGERVEGILALAEEQAADTIRSAEAEAERIVADARTRAAQLPD